MKLTLSEEKKRILFGSLQRILDGLFEVLVFIIAIVFVMQMKVTEIKRVNKQ